MKENKIGLVALTALVFSAMVGAGIFSLPQNMAEVAGVNAVLVGWLITGVGILLLAGCFLQLSRAKPELDGGIYIYAREGFGELAGFLSAWGYWLCATIGVVGYLVVAFAALGAFVDTPTFTLFGQGNTLMAFICESIILWAVHLIIVKGIKQASFINLLGTIAKVIPLLLFIGFAYAYFDPNVFKANQSHVSVQTDFIDQVKNTMLITLWVFTGIEGAAVLSARAKNRKDIGLATVIGVVAALILYIAITMLSFGIMNQSTIAQLSNPSMAGIMAMMSGTTGKVIISAGLIVSVLASYLSWIIYAAEVPNSAAKYGAFPNVFKKQNHNGTSIASLTLTSLTVQLCLVLILFTGESYNTLVLVSTSMILVPYFLVAAYMVKVAFAQKLSVPIKLMGLGASVYGLWLVYAAGLNTLALSLILYIPGTLLFMYSRKQFKLNQHA
ncbi:MULTISPECIES: basic amino acid/polyamine antiporter [Pseudoalteromonas]|jgi:arginine:ornithine antiporter/lysine permease|uniref:Amino acid APC transporter n=1 Tax=Pseudoalteromonas atlantica TaxID=288 RepID=A0ABQ0UFG4_PSEAF|nr:MULTISPECIES: basic amino acid/polyamine antiporter [Pseudoalteromonas]GEK77207.1 amino acid APC transporter [Pseudoalteromonas atlantica]MBB1402770.1 amino acid permease [Pseudoalteromonas sp. SG45-1]MBB1431753.1 amino acid permease [Pseudoalteromonas sp. SG43-4]MCQ8821994.1 basic amino acid/polyamine antiporter [Pseudoalteromonas agarivorans]MDC9498287.1 basic amino acid/polyamine antiporter [Pseudoalteromonas sp. Angola-20]|tara:strand:+ start:3203 stop:4528 length:1326 start_codon:yes stop_codon:yes gene_type:complete